MMKSGNTLWPSTHLCQLQSQEPLEYVTASHHQPALFFSKLDEECWKSYDLSVWSKSRQRKMIVRWRTRRLAEIEHSQNHFWCNCALFRLFSDFYQALLKLAFSPLVHEFSQKYSVRASITQTIFQTENVRRGVGGNKLI